VSLSLSLAGKVALVTGGATGIGCATAIALARAGAAVAIDHLETPDAAAEVVALIREEGGRAAAFSADVGDPEAVERLVGEVEKALGPVDILVNNAGIPSRKPLLEVPLEEFDRVVRTNFYGTFHCARAVASRLVGRGSPGKIVNISSIHGRVAKAGMGPYCATKAAIDMLTMQLAVELAPYGIDVVAVAPGTIGTDINVPLYKSDRPEDVALRAALMKRVPKGRLGRPEDIANTVVFLVSDLVGYITGTVVYVDGGYTAEGTPRV
jgi:NAD(P)-dependent dehydrogenase (short-subunit alcohol dehydrogenase family)